MGSVCVPPAAMGRGGGPLPRVVHEDDHVAVVENPEGLITVGYKREDLRSVLPFILRPPAPAVPRRRRRRRSSGNPTEPLFVRLVHRLDHRTSGLVVLDKTDRAATALS